MRRSLAEAAEVLGEARPLPLLLAALCAPLVPAATAAAWQSVLSVRDEPLMLRQVWACYGVGCLANTFIPGRLGEAVRIEAFARQLNHARGRWLACGVSGAVALAQSIVMGLVLALAAIAGGLPLWIAAPSFAIPIALWVSGAAAARWRPDSARVACLATATTLPVSAWARVLGLIAASALARFAVVVSVLEAVSVPHPIAGAVVAIGARAVGNAVPFAPGGAGFAAAAVAVALARSGVDTGAAVAAAVSWHALETGAAVLFGASGWLVVRLGSAGPLRPEGAPDFGVARAAAGAS